MYLLSVVLACFCLQDLDKKDAIAEKQRESIMVGFNRTKSELGTLQDALAKTQIELEKTNFELHAKQSMLLLSWPSSRTCSRAQRNLACSLKSACTASHIHGENTELLCVSGGMLQQKYSIWPYVRHGPAINNNPGKSI